MSVDLLILQTGGTIDKVYPAVPGNREFEIGDAAIKRIMGIIAPGREYQFISICRKDSQDINALDLRRIVEQCHATSARNIIITHGTDTMLATAKYLHEHRNLIDGYEGKRGPVRKRIVITGAMQPAAMRDTDADGNVGGALCSLPYLPPGVYIGMSGAVLPWERVARDAAGRFYCVR